MSQAEAKWSDKEAWERRGTIRTGPRAQALCLPVQIHSLLSLPHSVIWEAGLSQAFHLPVVFSLRRPQAGSGDSRRGRPEYFLPPFPPCYTVLAMAVFLHQRPWILWKCSPWELQLQLSPGSGTASFFTLEVVITPRVARLEIDWGWFNIPCWFGDMFEQNPFFKLSAITIPFWVCSFFSSWA